MTRFAELVAMAGWPCPQTGPRSPLTRPSCHVHHHYVLHARAPHCLASPIGCACVKNMAAMAAIIPWLRNVLGWRPAPHRQRLQNPLPLQLQGGKGRAACWDCGYTLPPVLPSVVEAHYRLLPPPPPFLWKCVEDLESKADAGGEGERPTVLG